MHDKTIGEIEVRIKRLEAEIEILEGSLERLERTPNKFSPKPKNDSKYYLIFMALWLIAGTGILAYLSSSGIIPGAIKVPLLPYLLIAFTFLLSGLAYVLWERSQGKYSDQRGDIEEKIRSANLVIKHFYVPLKRALEENDFAALKKLAEALLNDPILSRAVERTGEGDPKRMAYALYLYTSYGPEMKEEVVELMETLNNRALRSLLNELIDKGQSQRL